MHNIEHTKTSRFLREEKRRETVLRSPEQLNSIYQGINSGYNEFQGLAVCGYISGNEREARAIDQKYFTKKGGGQIITCSLNI